MEDTYQGQVDNPLSLNRYTYVHNNPVNNIDPSGLWCTSSNGKWSHPGDNCSSSSSEWSPDGMHVFQDNEIRENGKVTGEYGYTDYLKDYVFTLETALELAPVKLNTATNIKQAGEATRFLFKVDLQFFAKATLGKLTYRNGVWVSTAGLIYGSDRKFGNRVLHVLAHATPDPTKTAHTVFNVSKDKILGLIDEAWQVKGSPLVNAPGVYEVNMGRVIGTNGENVIRIVVKPNTAEIITAYPIP